MYLLLALTSAADWTFSGDTRNILPTTTTSDSANGADIVEGGSGNYVRSFHTYTPGSTERITFTFPATTPSPVFFIADLPQFQADENECSEANNVVQLALS